VLTDKESVMNIPLIEVDAFNNSVMLAGQNYALHEMKNRIEECIREHDAAIENLYRQKRLREEESEKAVRKSSNKGGSNRNNK
jgi:hypothetical protein